MKSLKLFYGLATLLVFIACKKDESNQICDSTLDYTFAGSHLDYRFFDFVAETNGAFESIYWEFGDGQSAQGDTVSHTFSSSGSYAVKCNGLMECGETFVKEYTIVVSNEFEYRYVVDQIDVSVGTSTASEDFSVSQDLSEEDGLFGSGYLRANSNSSDPVAFSINFQTTPYLYGFVFGLTIYPTNQLTPFGFPDVGLYNNQMSPATALIQISHTFSVNGVNDGFIGSSLDAGTINVDITRSDSVMLGEFMFNIPPSLSGSVNRSGSGSFDVRRVKYYYP